MKKSLLPLALLMALAPLSWSTGCGGGDKAATPQQLEEHRQQHIKNADRERQEG